MQPASLSAWENDILWHGEDLQHSQIRVDTEGLHAQRQKERESRRKSSKQRGARSKTSASRNVKGNLSGAKPPFSRSESAMSAGLSLGPVATLQRQTSISSTSSLPGPVGALPSARQPSMISDKDSVAESVADSIASGTPRLGSVGHLGSSSSLLLPGGGGASPSGAMHGGAGLGNASLLRRGMEWASRLQVHSSLAAQAASPHPAQARDTAFLLAALQSTDLHSLGGMVKGRVRGGDWARAVLPPVVRARRDRGIAGKKRARGATGPLGRWDPCGVTSGGAAGGNDDTRDWTLDVDFGLPDSSTGTGTGTGTESDDSQGSSGSELRHAGGDARYAINSGMTYDRSTRHTEAVTIDLNDPEVARMALVASPAEDPFDPFAVRATGATSECGDGVTSDMSSLPVWRVRDVRRRQLQAMRAHLSGLQPTGQAEGGGGVATADSAHSTIHHSTPAIDLAMAPLEPTLADCREVYRTPAPGYVHPPSGEVIRVSAKLRAAGAESDGAAGASLGLGGDDEDEDQEDGAGGGDWNAQAGRSGSWLQVKTVEDLSVSQAGGNVVLVEYTEERPPVLPMAGMGSRLVTYYRRTALEDAEADRRARGLSGRGEGDENAEEDEEDARAIEEAARLGGAQGDEAAEARRKELEGNRFRIVKADEDAVSVTSEALDADLAGALAIDASTARQCGHGPLLGDEEVKRLGLEAGGSEDTGRGRRGRLLLEDSGGAEGGKERANQSGADGRGGGQADSRRGTRVQRLGQLVELDSKQISPLLGGVEEGEYCPAIFSSLLVAPVAKHDSQTGDFLVCIRRVPRHRRSGSSSSSSSSAGAAGVQDTDGPGDSSSFKWVATIREIPELLVAGQVEPKLPVAAPDGKNVSAMLDLFLSHQLAKFMQVCGGTMSPEVVQGTFLRTSAHVSLRNALERVAYYHDTAKRWVARAASDDTNLRTLRGTLTPEQVCQLLGMFAGLQALRDAGVVASAIIGAAQTSVNRLSHAIEVLMDRLDPAKMAERRHGVLGVVAQAAKERDAPDPLADPLAGMGPSEDPLQAGLRDAERRSRMAAGGGAFSGAKSLAARVMTRQAALGELPFEEAKVVAASALEGTSRGRAVLRRRLLELKRTKKACVAVLRLLQTTPWNLTESFVQATQKSGGGVLSLSGPQGSLAGDPSGRNLGFSFIKEPSMKKKTGQKKATVKREGTDRDSRKLTKAQLKGMLLEYGMDPQVIAKLTRWDLVRAVKETQANLADRRTLAGRGLAYDDIKFISSTQKTQIERQQLKKRHARALHRSQLKALRNADPLSSGSDTGSSDEDSELESSQNGRDGRAAGRKAAMPPGGGGSAGAATAGQQQGQSRGQDQHAAIEADFDLGGDDDADEGGGDAGGNDRGSAVGSKAGASSVAGSGGRASRGGAKNSDDDWERRATGGGIGLADVDDEYDEALELAEYRAELKGKQAGEKGVGGGALVRQGGVGGGKKKQPMHVTIRVLPQDLVAFSNPSFVNAAQFQVDEGSESGKANGGADGRAGQSSKRQSRPTLSADDLLGGDAHMLDMDGEGGILSMAMPETDLMASQDSLFDPDGDLDGMEGMDGVASSMHLGKQSNGSLRLDLNGSGPRSESSFTDSEDEEQDEQHGSGGAGPMAVSRYGWGADVDSSAATPLVAMDAEALNRLSLEQIKERAGSPPSEHHVMRRTVRRIDEQGREWVTVTFEKRKHAKLVAWLRGRFGLDLLVLSNKKRKQQAVKDSQERIRDLSRLQVLYQKGFLQQLGFTESSTKVTYVKLAGEETVPVCTRCRMWGHQRTNEMCPLNFSGGIGGARSLHGQSSQKVVRRPGGRKGKYYEEEEDEADFEIEDDDDEDLDLPDDSESGTVATGGAGSMSGKSTGKLSFKINTADMAKHAEKSTTIRLGRQTSVASSTAAGGAGGKPKPRPIVIHEAMGARLELGRELERFCVKLQSDDTSGLFGLRSEQQIREQAARQGIGGRVVVMTPLHKVLVRGFDEEGIREYQRWKRAAERAKENGLELPPVPTDGPLAMPVDMAGVKRKCAKGAYSGPYEFLKDVRRVVDRARAHGQRQLSMGEPQRGNRVLQLASRMLKAAEAVTRLARMQVLAKAVKAEEQAAL